MKKGYALYGKEGTLALDLDADQLLLGLKTEGAELKPVTLEEGKIATWRVRFADIFALGLANCVVNLDS